MALSCLFGPVILIFVMRRMARNLAVWLKEVAVVVVPQLPGWNPGLLTPRLFAALGVGQLATAPPLLLGLLPMPLLSSDPPRIAVAVCAVLGDLIAIGAGWFVAGHGPS